MTEPHEHDQEPAQDLPPLKVPLPSPPTIDLKGIRYRLEHVPIEGLHAYRRQHHLTQQRVTFLGQPGWWQGHDGKMRFGGLGHCIIHWPESWVRED